LALDATWKFITGSNHKAVERIDVAFGVDNLPVGRRGIERFEIVAEGQNMLLALFGMHHCAGIGFDASEGLAVMLAMVGEAGGRHKNQAACKQAQSRKQSLHGKVSFFVLGRFSGGLRKIDRPAKAYIVCLNNKRAIKVPNRFWEEKNLANCSETF
jgi:hypothetical protein